MIDDAIRIGVVGCGGFGLFALQNFTQIPGTEVVGMSESYGPAAEAAAERFGIAEQDDIEKLVARDDVDIIYIATPPFLHHPQVMNPLYDAVKRLIDSRLLGEPLHGYFENYAKDEQLPPDHWFWDRGKSGGIFIEHGVHFFDMFAGWFGTGEVVAAQRTVRPGTTFEEQMHCTVRYGETVLVNFYHGFHQAERMDRQEMRLVFERGDVTLYEWVPTRVRIHAIADEKAVRHIAELFPGARVDVKEDYKAEDRVCHARHKELDVSQRFELTSGEGVQKMARYGELLRAIFEDQAAWIRDRSHVRKITEENGRASLAMAVEADRLAHGHQGDL